MRRNLGCASRLRHRFSDRLDACLLNPFTSHESDKRLLTDDCRLQFVDECWPIALGSSWLMKWRPPVPLRYRSDRPSDATARPVLCCSPCAAELPPPLKTWPSFDAEGVGIAFWRLVEAFVLMNGRRGQRGHAIGQSSTRVRRWWSGSVGGTRGGRGAASAANGRSRRPRARDATIPGGARARGLSHRRQGPHSRRATERGTPPRRATRLVHETRVP